MKSVLPTEIQKKIISDHMEIEGHENFYFSPVSNGLRVYMVNRNNGEITLIDSKLEPQFEE